MIIQQRKQTLSKESVADVDTDGTGLEVSWHVQNCCLRGPGKVQDRTVSSLVIWLEIVHEWTIMIYTHMCV